MRRSRARRGQPGRRRSPLSHVRAGRPARGADPGTRGADRGQPPRRIRLRARRRAADRASRRPAAGSAQTGKPADVKALRARWPEVLEAVQRKRRVAWMQLSHATVQSFADGVLTLAFAQAGVAKGFVTGGYDKDLGQVLESLLGITPVIRTEVAGPGRSGQEPPAGPGSAGQDPPAGAWPARRNCPANSGPSAGAALAAVPASPPVSSGSSRRRQAAVRGSSQGHQAAARGGSRTGQRRRRLIRPRALLTRRRPTC